MTQEQGRGHFPGLRVKPRCHLSNRQDMSHGCAAAASCSIEIVLVCLLFYRHSADKLLELGSLDHANYEEAASVAVRLLIGIDSHEKQCIKKYCLAIRHSWSCLRRYRGTAVPAPNLCPSGGEAGGA
jgi:hypothetical protein